METNLIRSFLMAEFCRTYGPKLIPRSCGLVDLLEIDERHSEFGRIENLALAAFDHPMLFTFQGKPSVLVVHNRETGAGHVRLILEVCSRWDLVACFSGRVWFRGTWRLDLWRRDMLDQVCEWKARQSDSRATGNGTD